MFLLLHVCLLFLAEGIKLTEKAIINQMDGCFVPGCHPAGSVGYSGLRSVVCVALFIQYSSGF